MSMSTRNGVSEKEKDPVRSGVPLPRYFVGMLARSAAVR